MVGHDAKGDVDLFLLGFVGDSAFQQRARIFFAAQFFDLIENRAENVGLVIRNCTGEIAEIFCTLNDRGHAFEPHSGIDVTLRQGCECSIGVRVELNENQIPNLDAARIVLVHECATRVAVESKIDMDFGTRPAGACIAHHPEIIGLAATENVNLRIEIGVTKQTRPVLIRFLVELARLARSRLVNRRIKPLCWKFPALDK